MGLAVLDSDIMACLPKSFRRRQGAPPHVARSRDRGGAAATRREVEGVVVKDDAVLELCVRGRARYA